ncbi:MAG: glycosyltransferase [Deltaproteobacteria bacterium]|nr:glycosyltransferase [Deltaproteobacteria bacterium]
MIAKNFSNISAKISYSIIVPTHNTANTLDYCLKELVKQEIQNGLYEIIVVDDGSIDNSLTIAKHYPVKILENVTQRGAYASRNIGIRNASGEILIFIDATCYPEHDWLSKLINGFTHEDIGCVAGQILSAVPATIAQHFSKDKDTHNMNRFFKKETPFFAGGNVAIKRDVFKRIGLFDESLKSGGDGDFSLRINLDKKYRIVYQPSACVYYHHREYISSLFKQAYKYGTGIAQFRLNYQHYFDSKKNISLLPNIMNLLKQIMGFLLVPWKIAAGYRIFKDVSKAFIYPFIDKVHTIFFHSGIIIGLIKYRNYKRLSIPKLNDYHQNNQNL